MRRILGLLCIFLFLGIASSFAADEAQLMSAEELKSNLYSENISILDARSEPSWKNSEFKIPGAVRATWDNFDEWSASLPKDRKLVLYCS